MNADNIDDRCSMSASDAMELEQPQREQPPLAAASSSGILKFTMEDARAELAALQPRRKNFPDDMLIRVMNALNVMHTPDPAAEELDLFDDQLGREYWERERRREAEEAKVKAALERSAAAEREKVTQIVLAIALKYEREKAEERVAVCAVVVDEMIAELVDIEAWLARLRPSAADLAAGATTVGSHELKAHMRMLRCVGELSASKMLGEKAGAPPGKDADADAAWRFLAENLHLHTSLVESAVAAAPAERKADVTRLFAWLLTARGLRYLRALAHELWVIAGSPSPTAMDVDTAVARVDWPACWAWCDAAPRHDAKGHTRCSHPPACHLSSAQGLSHRGRALQRGARRRSSAVQRRRHACPMWAIGKLAANGLPHRFGERLLCADRHRQVV